MPVVMCKPYNEPLPIDPTFDEPETARNLAPSVNTLLSLGGGPENLAPVVNTLLSMGGGPENLAPQVLT